jgi:hypothetical protein
MANHQCHFLIHLFIWLDLRSIVNFVFFPYAYVLLSHTLHTTNDTAFKTQTFA